MNCSVWNLFKITLPCLMLNACTTKPNSNSKPSISIEKSRTMSVLIQPFGEVPLGYLQFVKSSLRNDFSEVQILSKIELPQFAFVGFRKRYDANKMLKFLQELYEKRKYSSGTFLVGITQKDICQNRQNPELWKGKKGFGSPYYGIMGLGFRPHDKNGVPSLKVNINSTKRLKSDVKEQLDKLIKHEIGHNFGIPHCSDLHCIMRDAEGGNHFDEMYGFCKKCNSKFETCGN